MEMVTSLIYWFGFAVAFAGIVGYSSQPTYELDRHERYIKAVAAFYLIASSSFLLDILYHVFCIAYLRLLVLLALFIATLYLVADTGIDKFNIRKLKNALIYGVVAWLAGKDLNVIGEYSFVVASILFFIPLLIFIVSVYLIHSVQEGTVYFTFEEHITIISLSLFVVYTSGLAALSNGIPGVYTIFQMIGAGVLLYVLCKLWSIARLFMVGTQRV